MMIQQKLRVAAIGFILCVTGNMQAAHTQQASASDRLDAALEYFDRHAMFNGVVAIDVGHGEIIRRSIGNADYRFDIANGPNTRFRIASLSKVFTDAVVAALIENGTLTLETRLSEFLPGFPNANQITIEHLIRHQSGIPHTNNQDWGDGSIRLSRQNIVERLSLLPADFQPGSETRYSNGGYAVLVVALETATGERWEQLVAREVLEPLELRDTGVITDSQSIVENLATGYEPGPMPSSRRRSRFYAVEMRPGGGDMYSTADDIYRFFSAIIRSGFPGQIGHAAVFGNGSDTGGWTGRSPGFYAVVHYEQGGDFLLVSLANNYAADFNWGVGISSLVLDRPSEFDTRPDPHLDPGAGVELISNAWRYENPRFSQDLEITSNGAGGFVIRDQVSHTQASLIPLPDGQYLEPLYFGICSFQGNPVARIRCERFYETGFVADLIPHTQGD